MKIKILLVFLTFLISQGLTAQTNVSLFMHQKLGNQAFAFDHAVTVPGDYLIKATRLQYYVSEIEIIHDGGQVTPVTSLYLLVSAQKDSLFDLGSFAVENIEGIQFSIGVDPAHNHLDPSTYNLGHPLGNQTPSMHWGWTAGYRFIAFEGVSSINGTTFPYLFQVHTIDDANYQAVALDLQAVWDVDHLVIHIDADYTQLLKDIDVQGGLISHAATGPSATIAVNMRDYVFTPSALVNGVIDPGIAGSFSVSPNPAGRATNLNFDFPGYERLTIKVTDIAGQVVFERELTGSAQTVPLEVNWQPGLYVASVFSGWLRLAVEKIVVK